ncbi:MAG: uroporphyrinogen-III synthase [Sphingobium sp.]|nr:uroporphyrinogen-III synthase [Sphingobium sp.]
MIPLVLLRPQPGNDASAARAREMGLTVIQLPLFDVLPADGGPAPTGPFDALLLTSINGVRFGATVMAAFADLPAYAVGAATAHAARVAGGHERVITGGGDARSAAAMMVADGRRNVLHISGEHVRPFDSLGMNIRRHIVYRAVERDMAAIRAVLSRLGPAVVALHSPRAAVRFSSLVPAARRMRMHIAAISDAAARVCGKGWASITISDAPDDTALLHCVETLCIRAG